MYLYIWYLIYFHFQWQCWFRHSYPIQTKVATQSAIWCVTATTKTRHIRRTHQKLNIFKILLYFKRVSLTHKSKFKLSNGHSPQICKNGELLVRMCRMRVSFFQKWPLANVGEFGESEQNRLANVGESGEYLPSLLMNVGSSKIGHFMHK
jgi:hypothetical protein